jgi:hypothetical protein
MRGSFLTCVFPCATPPPSPTTSCLPPASPLRRTRRQFYKSKRRERKTNPTTWKRVPVRDQRPQEGALRYIT